MRAVVQRVDWAKVKVAGKTVGAIGQGLLVLLGVKDGDGPPQARWLADKCLNLRIFEDETGKMNRSVRDLGGELLVVSQFTLYGDAGKGRRPSFGAAARPEISEPLYRFFVDTLTQESDLKVATGEFGAEMEVELCNHGPVTLIVESAK